MANIDDKLDMAGVSPEVREQARKEIEGSLPEGADKVRLPKEAVTDLMVVSWVRGWAAHAEQQRQSPPTR